MKKEVYSLVNALNNYVVSNNLNGIEKIRLSNPPTTEEIYSLYDFINEIDKSDSGHKNTKSIELKQLKDKLEAITNFDKEKWENETLVSLNKERKELEENLAGLTFFALVRKQMIKNRINEINKIIADQSLKLVNYEEDKKKLEDKISQIENSILNQDENESLEKIESFKKQLDSMYLTAKAIDFFIENIDFFDSSKTIIESCNVFDDLNKNKPFNYKKMYKCVVLPLIHKVYEKYGYNVSTISDKLEGKNYQFIQYIKLTLASLFLEKPFLKDKMICIDEGQEYSRNEYVLLADINSDKDTKLILNIYGDIHQRNTSKGIADWNVFVPDICSKTFNLFENYRNTSEIVNYTNKKLGLSDIAIGLDDGNEVEELNANEALKVIEEGNICIIIKENSDLYLRLIDFVKFNSKMNGNILLTPWLSKGQEFEKVIVFDKEMDNTEKYISYTRAKSKLYICSDF